MSTPKKKAARPAKLRAFNNSPALKARIIKTVEAHRKADEIEQGTYGGTNIDGNWRGCAVACTVRAINKEFSRRAELDKYGEFKRIGIPEDLARWDETIFEKMKTDEAKKWPVRFLKAIPVGADLSKIGTEFTKWWQKYEEENGDIMYWEELRKAGNQLIKMLRAAKK